MKSYCEGTGTTLIMAHSTSEEASLLLLRLVQSPAEFL